MRRGLALVAGIVVAAAAVAAVVGAVAAGWIQAGPARGLHARLSPRKALAHDYLEAARAIRAYQDTRGHPPYRASELPGVLRDQGADLRYTRLEDESWLDPWGRPMVYRPQRMIMGLGWSVRLYSTGPDGEDQGGSGDDILLDASTPELARAAAVLHGAGG